jgi:hypothetical protein
MDGAGPWCGSVWQVTWHIVRTWEQIEGSWGPGESVVRSTRSCKAAF